MVLSKILGSINIKINTINCKTKFFYILNVYCTKIKGIVENRFSSLYNTVLYKYTISQTVVLIKR